MRILGIDPGLAVVGLGLVQCNTATQVTAEDWLCVTTAANTPTAERLLELSRDIETYVTQSRPDLIVVERLFFATNKQTAIEVAQARGAILATVAKHGVPILEPTPLQLKQCITGDGRADKRQVQDMVVRTLRLRERPTPDDAADGLALALYGAFSHQLLLPVHAGSIHAPASQGSYRQRGQVRGGQKRLVAGKRT